MSLESQTYRKALWIAESTMSNAGLKKMPHRIGKLRAEVLRSVAAGASHRDWPLKDRAFAALELLRKNVVSVKKNNGAAAHADIAVSLSYVFMAVAYYKRKNKEIARRLSADLCIPLDRMPKGVRNFINGTPDVVDNAKIEAMTGIDQGEWYRFLLAMTSIAEEYQGSISERIMQTNPPKLDLDISNVLKGVVEGGQGLDYTIPEYDESERGLRIHRVEVEGFRGSTQALSLDFRKRGKASNVLIWGDNGQGKSTIIDGIEFALQYRVDRSADYNSTLRPAVVNKRIDPKTGICRAAVELSDETIESREIVTNNVNRLEPSSKKVRPGFRLAPIVIRRADIIRFLDTESADRGTVFFDYFPSPHGDISLRPDEEIIQLREHSMVLRMARKKYAIDLRKFYPDARVDFENLSELDNFLEELLQGKSVPQGGKRIDLLPDGVREVVANLRECQQQLKRNKATIDRGVESLNPIAFREQRDRVIPVLRDVSNDLAVCFRRIVNVPHISDLAAVVEVSGPSSLDVVVHFRNGSYGMPQQVFSEGYKDLVALLFFLLLAKRAGKSGQAEVLILDDALQSVDSEVRLRVMEYILDEFSGWQIIVGGHDRAWFEQVRELFVRKGSSLVVYNFDQWTFDDGPALFDSMGDRRDSLAQAVGRSDRYSIVGNTGPLLEQICYEVGLRVGASVVRREGDRYSLGDAWPSVYKKLKKTHLRDSLETIDSFIALRNFGLHYNEWADSISDTEVRLLGQAVLSLYDSVFCGVCFQWAEKSNGCRCGNVSCLTG